MNITQKTILNAFKDEDFAREFISNVIRPNVLELDPKKKYILLLDSPIDMRAERAFVDNLQGYDVVLLTGAKGQLLELSMEDA